MTISPRRRAGLVLGIAVSVLWASPGAPAVAARPAGSAPCPTGWRDGSTTPANWLLDVRALGDGSAVAVGRDTSEVRRRWLTRWWDGTAWASTVGTGLAGDRGLLGVSGDTIDGLWAVGYAGTRRSTALAMQWSPDGWVEDSPLTPSGTGQTLSDVDVDPDGGVWAVGQSITAGPTRRALIWQRTPGGWVQHTPTVPRRSGLTAVAAPASDDVWVVGAVITRTAIRPYVLHWDGTGWTRERPVITGSEIVLTGVAAASSHVWAVGWQVTEGRARPLLLQRTDAGWREEDPPDIPATASLLTDIDLASGAPWVAGAVYRDATDRYAPMAARLRAAGWQYWLGAGRYLAGVDGDPLADGWLVGQAVDGGLDSRLCVPSDAPAPDRASRSVRVSRGTSRPADRRLPRPLDDAAGEGLPRPVRGLRPVADLDPPLTPTTFAAREVAAEVGLDLQIRTHGAAVGDIDGDGLPDLFISHHSGVPSLWVNGADGFVRVLENAFSRVDRHDCALGRMDAGPLPDLVCLVGADGGVGFTSNELYLDPGSGSTDEVGVASGIGDIAGRGRTLALFDADRDGDQDLFVGNLPLRYDGYPAPNRLFLNDGNGGYSWDPASGLTSDRGAACVVPGDIDRDGDLDLVVCGRTGGLLRSAGIIVYTNTEGSFRDSTAALGVRSIGEVDAAWAQLGGSRRGDLVQLSGKRLRISLWSKGRFTTVFERSLVGGRALAIGDANGDGANDIYLQLGRGKTNTPDLLLVNDGTGRSWTTHAVPVGADGTAQDVVAIDHDGNGMTDFLVLNGASDPGPVELIAFYPVPEGEP